MFFEAEFWVAVSFFIFMGIAWKMGVFTTVANGLDKRGDRIRAELTALNVEVMDGPAGATWRIPLASKTGEQA